MHDNDDVTQPRLAWCGAYHGLHALTSGHDSADHAATVTWTMQIKLKVRRVAVCVRQPLARSLSLTALARSYGG